MKRPLVIAVTLIVVAVAALLLIPRTAGDPQHEFEPFTAGDDAEVITEAAVDPSDPSKGVVRTTRKTVRKRVEPREDTLNRTGPEGAEAMERVVRNRRPRPDDVPDRPAPVGQLEKDDIRKGIEAVRPLVKVCYEDTLKEFPDAAGKVTIGFRIIGEDDKGRVEMTELADDGTTLFDEKLHDCLQKRVAEAEFETPSGGGVVNVNYPFVFSNDADE